MKASFLVLGMVLCLVLFSLSGERVRAGDAPKVFRVADYGAVGDGSHDDRLAVDKALATALQSGGPATVLFEAKTYRIGQRDDRWESFDLTGAHDLTVDGQGAMLIFHPNNRCFLIERGRGVVIRNFVIDFDPLPFTQGDVVAVAPDKGSFDVKLHAGYPDPPSQEWMQANYGAMGWRHGPVMDPRTRTFTTKFLGGFFCPDSVQPVDAAKRIYRIQTTDFEHLKLLAPGDRYVSRVRYATAARNDKLKGLQLASFRIWESADCRLENIRQYCSPDMWIHLQNNTGRITIDGCRMTYKPGTTRLVTNMMDGVHCKSARVGPLIQNCLFEGLMDDSINISRMEDAVVEARSETVFRLMSTEIAWIDNNTLEVGDELMAMDRGEGRELGRARVAEIMERQGHMRLVRLDRPIHGVRPQKDPAQKEYTGFYNLSACGNGFVVRNNIFLAQMRSALVARASGVFEDNYVDDVGGLGVYYCNDLLQFNEGPVPTNGFIRRNRFVNCRHHPAIAISTASLNPKMAPLAHDILIEDNDISVLGNYPAIVLNYARDITIRRNTISVVPGQPAVDVHRCQGIKMQENELGDCAQPLHEMLDH